MHAIGRLLARAYSLAFLALGCVACVGVDSPADNVFAADTITSTTVEADSEDAPTFAGWASLSTCLIRRYGHPPVSYVDALDEISNLNPQQLSPVETSLIEQSFATAAAQNARLPELQLTAYEVLMNQMVEGAVLIARSEPNRSAHRNWFEIWQLTGVQEIYFRGRGNGLYSWYDRIADASVQARIRGCEHVPPWREGSTARWPCAAPISLLDGAHIHAAAWAEARERFLRKLRALTSTVPRDPSQWFYWTTIFYNTTEAFGQRILQEQCSTNACDLEPRPFRSARDPRNPRSNAARRIAIFQAMRLLLHTQLPRLAARFSDSVREQEDVCPP